MWKREKEELRKQLDEISSSNKALDPLGHGQYKALDPLGHGQLTDTMAVASRKPLQMEVSMGRSSINGGVFRCHV